MAAPTRYGGASFAASGFSSTAGGTVDIGSDPDTVIIIRGGENTNSSDTLVGVTVNGVSATALTAGTRSGGGDVNTWVITSDDGDIGSGNVTVTLTMSSNNAKPGCVVEVWHGCVGSPRYTVGTATNLAFSAAPSKTESSDTSSQVVLTGSVSGGITVVGASGTTVGASTASGSSLAGDFALYKAGATSVTLNWTHNFSEVDYVQAVFLHGSAGTSYSITADQGSYTISGQDATLVYYTPGPNAIVCDSGSYTITGSSALIDYAINAEAGNYSLTGYAARLVWSGAPADLGRNTSLSLSMKIGM